MPDVDYSNPLAERAVLGAALLGVPDGLASLDPTVDFSDPRSVAVARGCRSLLDAGRAIDPAGVLVAMQSDSEYPWGRTSEVGAYLVELVESCAIPMSSTWFASSVRAATCRRRLQMASVRLETWASAGDLDPGVLVEQVRSELRDVAAFAARIPTSPSLKAVAS